MPEQKTVFIAGASSGIGFALSKEFHSRGYKVFAGSRKVEKMAPLAELGIVTLSIDVTSKESIQKAKELIEEQIGDSLDILYLNAGMTTKGTLLDMEIDKLEFCFKTNVFGPLMVLQAFQHMLLNAGGAVAFTSSIAIHSMMPCMYPYTASKTAFDILARQLALETSALGIKTVNIRTGAIESEIWEPPYTPPKESVYYLGDDQAMTLPLEPKKIPAELYAKYAVNDIERAIRRERVYTCVYRGPSVVIAWMLGQLPFTWYIPLVHKFTKFGDVLQRVQQKLWRQKKEN